MKGKAEQSLRKGAGGNFAKAGQAGCPLPPARAEYPYAMPATQSVGTAQTIEVKIKRNEQRACDILGIDDDAAETGVAFAADDRHGATRRDIDRIPTPLHASP